MRQIYYLNKEYVQKKTGVDSNGKGQQYYNWVGEKTKKDDCSVVWWDSRTGWFKNVKLSWMFFVNIYFDYIKPSDY